MLWDIKYTMLIGVNLEVVCILETPLEIIKIHSHLFVHTTHTLLPQPFPIWSRGHACTPAAPNRWEGAGPGYMAEGLGQEGAG